MFKIGGHSESRRGAVQRGGQRTTRGLSQRSARRRRRPRLAAGLRPQPAGAAAALRRHRRARPTQRPHPAE